MRDELERFLAKERMITSTSLLFALLAAVVSICGLYAAISQNVTRRAREIGIRIAVGATPNRIRALVFRETGWVLFIGLLLGVPVVLAGERTVRALVSGVPPDTTTLLALTGLAMALVAILSSAWPAERAARTRVAAALRSE